MPVREPVPTSLVDYLFEKLGGTGFEELAKRLFALEYGEQFIPLGGIHDGGADGLVTGIYETQEQSTYCQFTVTPGSGAWEKISDTITALKKNGREVRTLIYALSSDLPKQDILAKRVNSELGVLVLFRDRTRIKQAIATNQPVADDFRAFFANELRDLVSQVPQLRGGVTEWAKDPTIYSFLQYELQDRFGREELLNRIADSLVYWSLRDTDPDKEIFRTVPEIHAAIESIFPNARSLISARVPSRLKELVAKFKGEQRIRRYIADGKYCLPHNLRQELAEQNATEVRSQDAFVASLNSRVAAEIGSSVEASLMASATEIAFQTVHAFFVEQGLALAAFLERRIADLGPKDLVVENLVERVVVDRKLKATPESLLAVMSSLRGVFYEPTDEERTYLLTLSKTSLLFGTINTSPRVLEYLNQMVGTFRLIVGTDLIIKALSERYLAAENQTVTNLLHLVAKAGGQLLLTDPVVHEVFTHVHAADQEFHHHYEAREQYLSGSEVSVCDRILIRAYFHVKRRPGGPKSWGDFLHQFVDPSELRKKSSAGEDDIRGFLMQRFSMQWLSTEDLENGIDLDARDRIAESLDAARAQASHESAAREKHFELSINDATLAMAVYKHRSRGNESATYDGFGLRTWWLTKETQVLSHTVDLVRGNRDVPYIMRPEFILNFVLLAPKAGEARAAMRNLLPSSSGLQLGKHVDKPTMQKLLAAVDEWKDMPPERVATKLKQSVDQLKRDRFKRYLHNL
jgi:hypothetical protein